MGQLALGICLNNLQSFIMRTLWVLAVLVIGVVTFVNADCDANDYGECVKDVGKAVVQCVKDLKNFKTCMDQKVSSSKCKDCVDQYCKENKSLCSSAAGVGVTYATLLITLMAIMLK